MPTVKVTGEDEPIILLDQVREVGSAMMKRKAPGCDGIKAELRQALGKSGNKEVWQLCWVICRIVNALLNDVSRC